MSFTTIPARALTPGHTLLTGVHGRFPVAITGEVETSTILEDTVLVETEIGTLYLPMAEMVTVTYSPSDYATRMPAKYMTMVTFDGGENITFHAGHDDARAQGARFALRWWDHMPERVRDVYPEPPSDNQLTIEIYNENHHEDRITITELDNL